MFESGYYDAKQCECRQEVPRLDLDIWYAHVCRRIAIVILTCVILNRWFPGGYILLCSIWNLQYEQSIKSFLKCAPLISPRSR